MACQTEPSMMIDDLWITSEFNLKYLCEHFRIQIDGQTQFIVRLFQALTQLVIQNDGERREMKKPTHFILNQNHLLYTLNNKLPSWDPF